MNITDTRTTQKSITYADIEVGTLFSPARYKKMVYMKTSECKRVGLPTVNSVNLKNGVLGNFEPVDEIIPINNYEFNIF